MKHSDSPYAIAAQKMITGLQSYFGESLTALCKDAFTHNPGKYDDRAVGFDNIGWLRHGGKAGGGQRLQAKGLEREHIDNQRPLPFFNRGSVNFSQVHYNQKDKRLRSATAISTIIHPHRPKSPSVHMHTSFTELVDGKIGFRVMADLNPSYLQPSLTAKFDSRLRKLAMEHSESGLSQGDAYFNIPFLNMRRGVSHFYLENFLAENSFEKTLMFCENFTREMMDCYCEILTESTKFEGQLQPRVRVEYKVKENFDANQIAYHSAYFAQVLLLDRGTTSGLLAHNENDVGTMGSIPAVLDLCMLNKWKNSSEMRAKPLQAELLGQLIEVCSDAQFDVTQSLAAEKAECKYVFVCPELKRKLAQVARDFYSLQPAALDHQARGFSLPQAYSNHK